MTDTGEINPTQRQKQIKALRNVLDRQPHGPIQRNWLYDHHSLQFMRDSIRQRLSDLRIEEGYSIHFDKKSKAFIWRGVLVSGQMSLI